MSELEHEIRLYGCSIRHDLENTRAELTDPDGLAHPFKSVAAEPNATLQAIRWAKVDEGARVAEAAANRKAAAEAKQQEQAASEADTELHTESEGDA